MYHVSSVPKPLWEFAFLVYKLQPIFNHFDINHFKPYSNLNTFCQVHNDIQRKTRLLEAFAKLSFYVFQLGGVCKGF